MIKTCFTFFCLFNYIFLFDCYKSKYCVRICVVQTNCQLENYDWMDSLTLLLQVSLKPHNADFKPVEKLN